MSIKLRNYVPEQDYETAVRIWKESGWIEEEKQQETLKIILQGAQGYLASLDGGDNECLTTTMPGSVRYFDSDIDLCAITSVITGLAARRQGLAGRATAHAMACSAEAGADVAMLGIFDQGFYDKLGFGTGSYERTIGFDAAHLKITGRPRPPRRISADDWQAAHAARLRRMRAHGNCNLHPAEFTRAEMLFYKNGFGLAYFDGDMMTHGFWAGVEGEHGPCDITWLSFRTYEEAIELLQLLHSLSDQIYLFRTVEPALIRIQDMLHTPFRTQNITKGSKLQIEFESAAYWQIRMLNVKSCIQKSPIPGMAPLRFNIRLTDPIDKYLGSDHSWRGVAGEYSVTLGREPECLQGVKTGLPVLEASVGAFSRLWFGVASANVIAFSDDLSGPSELLEQLSLYLRLPRPSTAWEF